MIEKVVSALRDRPQLQGPKALFGLRRGNVRTPSNPRVSELLLVAVQGEDLEWNLSAEPIVFTEDFERFVGMALPMGIGPHRPGMVIAVRRFANVDWEIVGSYTDMSYPALLWRERNPKWFKGEERDEKKTKARSGPRAADRKGSAAAPS